MRIRSILTIILIINVFILIYFLFRSETIVNEIHYGNRVSSNSEHRFKNPGTAFLIYTLLDIHEPIPDSYYNMFKPARHSFVKPHLGLFRDDGYCKRVKKFVTHLPEVVFNESGVFTDFGLNGRFRKEVIPLVGEDMMPELGLYNEDDTVLETRQHYLRRGIVNYFTEEPLHQYQELGKEFGCSNQMYNHIPGHGALFRNDLFAEKYYRYMRKYVTSQEASHCFNFEMFVPEFWNLDDERECRDFFKTELVRPYREKISYVSKFTNALHTGVDVDILTNEDEEQIKKVYKNGEECGFLNIGRMIQRFVDNPLLIDGYKFEIRAYMLIASTNPFLVYYHDGFIRRALYLYDDVKPDRRSIFPSIKMDKEMLHEILGNHEGMTEDDLREFRVWDYEQLGKYLASQNLTKPDWADSYLRPYIKSAMIHIFRAAQDELLVRSQLYEMVGVDFMLDSSFNLWFMENNMRSIFFGSSEMKVKKHMKMLLDMFDIENSLLRSRMKRIFKLIAEIEESHSKNQLRGMNNEIKEEKLQEFRQIEMNAFEPEYYPRADNGFELLIDGSKVAEVDKYQGYLRPECIL